MDRFWRMNVRPSRSWSNVDVIAACVSPTVSEPSAAAIAAGGGDAGSVKQNTAARKYSAATTRITACGPAMLIDERAQQREPDREGRVEREREDAVRREQLVARHDLGDHRRLGRREEHGHRRHEDVEQQDQREVVTHEDQPDDREPAQDVRRDEHEPAVDAVHVDARDRGEQHGGHEERQDEQADGRVRLASPTR